MGQHIHPPDSRSKCFNVGQHLFSEIGMGNFMFGAFAIFAPTPKPHRQPQNSPDLSKCRSVLHALENGLRIMGAGGALYNAGYLR